MQRLTASLCSARCWVAVCIEARMLSGLMNVERYQYEQLFIVHLDLLRWVFAHRWSDAYICAHWFWVAQTDVDIQFSSVVVEIVNHFIKAHWLSIRVKVPQCIDSNLYFAHMELFESLF